MLRTSLLLGALLIVGCASDQQTYSVWAKNNASTGVTLNLTKDVPQAEEAWASPEDIDADRVRVTPDSRLGIVDVPSGKTATINNISGHFEPGAHAVLRVYRGTRLTQRELLSVQPGPYRRDVVLKPGNNRFVVREQDGQIAVEPANP